MAGRLIVIRGNSNSGKTTLADRLQQCLGTDRCLVLHQDQLRRELLHAPDTPGTPAIALIATMVAFGRVHYPLVVLEGILRTDVYGGLLRELYQQPQTCGYYLTVTGAQTLANNATRPQPFPEAWLARWWRAADRLAAEQQLAQGQDWQAILMKGVQDD